MSLVATPHELCPCQPCAACLLPGVDSDGGVQALMGRSVVGCPWWWCLTTKYRSSPSLGAPHPPAPRGRSAAGASLPKSASVGISVHASRHGGPLDGLPPLGPFPLPICCCCDTHHAARLRSQLGVKCPSHPSAEHLRAKTSSSPGISVPA